MGRKTWLTHKGYEDSNNWRCLEAPINPAIELQVTNSTGAHYWLGLDGTEKMAGYFRCCHCGDVRRFPNRWDTEVNFANIVLM